MLPSKCAQPACMNMEVNNVAKSPTGLARNRLGTNAQRWMNTSPLLSSKRKTSTLMAIRTYVTIGVNLRPLLSSPRGIIGTFSFFVVRLDSDYHTLYARYNALLQKLL